MYFSFLENVQFVLAIIDALTTDTCAEGMFAFCLVTRKNCPVIVARKSFGRGGTPGF